MQPARRELGGGGAQFVAEDEVGAELGVVGGALGGPRDRLAKQPAAPVPPDGRRAPSAAAVGVAKVVIERPAARAVVAALRARAPSLAVRLEAVLAHEPLQLDALLLVRAAERRREPPEHVDRAAAALDKGVVRRESDVPREGAGVEEGGGGLVAPAEQRAVGVVAALDERVVPRHQVEPRLDEHAARRARHPQELHQRKALRVELLLVRRRVRVRRHLGRQRHEVRARRLIARRRRPRLRRQQQRRGEGAELRRRRVHATKLLGERARRRRRAEGQVVAQAEFAVHALPAVVGARVFECDVAQWHQPAAGCADGARPARFVVERL